MIDTTNEKINNLPWWTWVLPIIIFHLGTEITLLFKYEQGVSAIYLPTAFGVVLINWWGWKRIIPAIYINAALSTPLWGEIDLYMWLLYPIGETVGVLLSWWLFTKMGKGKFWLPDTQNVLKFIFWGLLIPFLIETIIIQVTSTLYGTQHPSLFFNHIFRNFLGETTAIFGISTLVLHFFSGYLNKKKLLLYEYNDLPGDLPQVDRKIELLVVILAVFVISFTLPFNKYWFVFGILSLFVAIRNGFAATLIINLVIFLVTYLLPAFTIFVRSELIQEDYLFNIFLGNLLLYVFAAITGRIISDLKFAEKVLSEKNQELETTNQELDKFVYSVSHDLSAPLRSIQGLITLSNLDSSVENRNEYLKKIDKSVNKLDNFIKEILDYSRNKRLEVLKEPIDISLLVKEIIDNHKYLDVSESIKFDAAALDGIKVHTDKVRLKLILVNIISNAIKFSDPLQRDPFIKIFYKSEDRKQKIIIEDNGVGIQEEHLPKIFNMFYRGHTFSEGSGLGLYIALESAEKIGGKIKVASTFKKGSTFTIEIPR